MITPEDIKKTKVDDSPLMPSGNTMYVVYDHPRDQPDHFVVRPWDFVGEKYIPRHVCGLFKELDSAREWCAQLGLMQTLRQSQDDPTIIEVWL
jgi:hypothetical protein